MYNKILEYLSTYNIIILIYQVNIQQYIYVYTVFFKFTFTSFLAKINLRELVIYFLKIDSLISKLRNKIKKLSESEEKWKVELISLVFDIVFDVLKCLNILLCNNNHTKWNRNMLMVSYTCTRLYYINYTRAYYCYSKPWHNMKGGNVFVDFETKVSSRSLRKCKREGPNCLVQ